MTRARDTAGNDEHLLEGSAKPQEPVLSAPLTETAVPRISESVRLADGESLECGIRQTWGWATMFGLAENSFALFASQVKMPAFLFGLLNGLPQLVGPPSQIVAANILDRGGVRRSPMVVKAVLLQCAFLLPLAGLGVWYLYANCQDGAMPAHMILLLSVSGYFIFGNFANPPWSSMISEVVPSSLRQWYFARNNRHNAIITMATQLAVAGALLYAGERTDATAQFRAAMWVFAGCFGFSAVARAISAVYMHRVKEPPYTANPETVFTFWQFIRRTPESNFVHFAIFQALIYFGANLSGPYFVPYWCYDLGLPAWQWALVQMAASLSSFMTLPLWGRFSHHFGNKKALRYASIGLAFTPMLWTLTPNPYLLIVINAIVGSFWAGFQLTTLNYLFEAVSPPKRARCVAYSATFMGMGIFIGSVLGGWLLQVLPPMEYGTRHRTSFVTLLTLSCVTRTLSLSLLPTFKELRKVGHFSLRQWIYQTTLRQPLRLIDFVEEDDEAETPKPVPENESVDRNG